jgi:hypothetical protein
MTTVLVFVYDGSAAQIAAGSMICFLFLLINIACKPYCTTGLNSLASFTLVAQFLTLFSGIMIALVEQSRLNGNEVAGKSEDAVIGTILFFSNCMTLTWPLVRQIWAGNLLSYLNLFRSLVDKVYEVLGKVCACLCCCCWANKQEDSVNQKGMHAQKLVRP